MFKLYARNNFRRTHHLFVPVVLGFFLVSCGHTPSPDMQKTDLHLQLGSQFLYSKNYPAAFRELTRALELNPSDPVVYNLLALTYLARRRLRQAEFHFKKSLELDPEYSEARNNLARLYIRLKRYSEAVEEFQKVVTDLKYQSPEKGYLGLGLVYYKTDRLRLAERSFLQALKLNKNYCQAYSFYGKTLLRQKKFKKASLVFDTAVSFCESFDELFYYNALSYLYAGSKTKAKVLFETFLTNYPQSKHRLKGQRHLENLITQNF